LCQRQEEFSQFNTKVIIVSFGTLPALQAWMRDTCNTFQVLLDSERKAYQDYQLETSRWRSWTPNTLWTYAKLLAAGRKWLPKEGDTSQMGGDFIVDTSGIVRLAYRSKDPADRPPVDALLNIIQKMQS
jgi:peroxiredoxin